MVSLPSHSRLFDISRCGLLVLLLTLLWSPAETRGQTASGQQSDATTDTSTADKPKQQKVETRTTAMAPTGDSAAGSIGGIKNPENTKVSSGGAATQSIPIAVPPGTAGVQPNLTLTYNSQGENSLLGVGWSVSGLPVIHRCPRTVAQDNFRGGVNYDTNDRFCLDGQRLMAISGTYGANLTEYRTELDSFLKIVSYGTAGTGPAYFTVKTKAGETMEFGGNATSQEGRIEAQGKSEVRVWALSKVSDAKGNYLTVTYAEDATNGEYRPTQIDYTGNAAGSLTPNRKVTFEYVTRTDQIPQWVGGSIILTTKLLSYVKTYVGATLVRDYRLEYETGTATVRSRLKRIRECDAAGNCLPANTPGSQPAWQLTWQEGGDGTITQVPGAPIITENNFSAPHTCAGDFNGDGKADLVSIDASKIWSYFSNGDGTFDGHSTTYDTNQLNRTYMWCGDFNADGRYDFASYSNNTIYTYTSSSQGDGTYQVGSQSVLTSQFDNLKVWIGDFNGDGRTDLISWKNSKMYTYFSNGNGTYQVVASPTFNTNQISVSAMVVADFNGDGKADLLSNTNGKLWTYFANGDGTFQQKSFDRTPYPNPATMYVGDFNGDGKADVVSFAPTQIRLFFSKGDGSYNYVSYTSPFDVYFIDDIAKFGDFNGDGKTDIIAYNDWMDCNPSCDPYLTTYFSKGNGDFSAIVQPSSATFLYPNQNWFLDLDGDGKTDYVFPILSGRPLQANFRLGAHPDLLTNIINPFGGQNTIAYKPLTDNTVYAKDTGALAATYPNVDLIEPVYVVSNIVVSDGVGSNYNFAYTYGGAKAHLLGRGSLGFRTTTEVDSGANVKKSTFFKQDFPLTGLPDTIEIDRNSDGAGFLDTINTYVTGNAYASAPTVSFVGLSQQDTIQMDGTGSSRTIRKTMEYDSFANGNLRRTNNLGDIAVNGDERDERVDWIVDAANWLHRPKRQALYDAGGALVREKWLYYDNQAHGSLGGAGLLTKEESNAGSGIGNVNNPTVSYGYDPSFGVRTSTTDARGCTTTTAYESTKTFPQTVTNCLTHQGTMVYDARFGVMTSQTDANGQTTTSAYDSFGRLTKVTGPLDGTSTYGAMSQFYLDWGNPALQRVVTYKTEQYGTANYIWTKEYFDGLGRGDVTQQEGPGGQIISTEKTIDSRGLVTAATTPHFTTETPVTTTSQYDVLGRETRVNYPDGTFATAAYAPGLVTLTDPRGKVKRKYLDAYNQLKQVDEVNGVETYVTTYAYDTVGSLTTVINHLSHTTRMAYDMVGRKVAMCDPNMGTASGVTSCTTASVGAWVYTYSTAGDLLTQKDAKNQTITFTYDSLGRASTKKQGSTSLVTWTYDDPAVLYSKGKVTQIVDQATTTKFAYDQVGRTSQTQRLQLGVWYTMAQQYDALSRITSETFPDSEVVNYSYNEAGWVSSVSGYINAITYNARGQKTALTYANNLTTTWSYDPNNFRPINRTTSNNQQNLTYGYDNNGNVTTITDALFTGSRTFTYDDLNRMITASGTFGANQSQANCTYVYNAIGDITNKCGTTFTYGDVMHPSAVTFNPATGKNYTYDANGNMLTRGNQTLTWDIDNRVSQISISGGGTTFMEYDYTGMRVKKNAPTGITLFPFQGYEIDPSGVVTKFIRIGTESFASKRGANKYFYHNDHLGSVNVVTDIAGTRVQLNEYDPWGGVSQTVGSIDPTHRFTGKELDPESGLYYYGGRYYDPEISRFVSPDPFIQSPSDPQSLNRYSYVRNNPQNYIDPSGYSFFSFFKKIFKWAFRVVFPVQAFANFLQTKITSLVPPKVNAGFNLFGGIAMLLNSNPGGLFYIASGIATLASGQSNGGQIASGVFGLLGGAASLAGGGGGSALGGASGGIDFKQSSVPSLVQALGASGRNPTDVINDPRIVYSKAWYQNRTGEDLSLNKSIFLGGTTSNAEIKSADPYTLYLRDDLLSINVSDENRYGTLFHEYVHYGSMKAMGIQNYFEKVEVFNRLGLTGGANPWERIAEYRGATLASEFLGRPVRPNSLYNLEGLR